MKCIKFLSVMAVLSTTIGMSGCTTYEKSVRENLKIPYVYVPPNDAYKPYTLLHYNDNSNFTPVCSAELLTNKNENELKKLVVSNKITSLEIKKKSDIEFNIKLDSDDLGNVNAKYNNISKITISFSNGRQLSFPTIQIVDVVDRIKSTKCAGNLRIFNNELKSSKFLLPIVVYGYDLNYKVLTESGGNITAEIPPEVLKLVTAEIGIDYNSSSSIKMAGSDVFIGFRGVPTEESIFDILFGSQPKTVAFVSDEEYVLDVTDLVNEIISK